MIEMRRFEDSHALAHGAAQHVIALASRAIARARRFSLVLSGGRTPRELYSLLATNDCSGTIEWACVHIFWGDERCVPPDNAESNYRMARETLLDHVPIPAANIHRIKGELAPAAAADDYEQTLREFQSIATKPIPTNEIVNLPQFDLILLGMGDDGHTASLFPGTPALHEHARWVVAQYVPPVGAWRVTLTPTVINNALNVAFLIAGNGKARRLQQVINGEYRPEELPAQLIRPVHRRLVWLVDTAAAAHLDQDLVI